MNGLPNGQPPDALLASESSASLRPATEAGSRLYAIADLDALGPLGLADGVQAMAEAGIPWVQVRAKSCTDAEHLELVEECCVRVEGTSTVLWVDDRADIAALLPVIGVHVGQQDLPPAAVRRLVGAERWIGRSTHDEKQLLAANADDEVDVVALGPIFATSSKASPDPVVGLDFLRKARELTAKPLVAIGGIDAERLPSVLATGVDRVAVLGAVCHGDVYRNCLRLLAVEEGSL